MTDRDLTLPDTTPAPGSPGDLREVAWLSLKLGCIAFGGPAAHIAMLRDEVVTRRGWLSDQRFLDLVGATNLIPGPNSTEMVIHVGQIRAGWRGLIVGGALFILPAALITLAFAWAYGAYGTTPAAGWLLYGIKPVVIAIIAQAIWGLARTAITRVWLLLIAIGAVILFLLGLNELLILAAGAVIVLLVTARRQRAVVGPAIALLAIPLPREVAALPLLTALATAIPAASLGALFLVFLKIGAVLYGGGYVLLAFLRTELVLERGWLTDQQLLDAVAVGQVTPGPLFSTATFVGYLVAGLPGAALATLGIFLPSFCFVAVLHRVLPRLRRSPWTAALLDGVNVAALGLMAGILWELGRDAIIDWRTALLAVVTLVVLLRFRPNSAWLVAAGGVIGLLLSRLG